MIVKLIKLYMAITEFPEKIRRIPAKDFMETMDEIEELKREHEKLVGKTAMLLVAESLLDHVLRETEKNIGTLGEALADTFIRLKTLLSRMPNKQLRREVLRVTDEILGKMAAALREELSYIRDDLASAGQSSTSAQLVENVLAQPHVLEELHKRLGSLERCRSGLDLLEAALKEAQRREEKLWHVSGRSLLLGFSLLAFSLAIASMLKHGLLVYGSYVILTVYLLVFVLYTASIIFLYYGTSRLLDYAILKRWFSEFRQLVRKFRKRGSGPDCDRLFMEAVTAWKKLVK